MAPCRTWWPSIEPMTLALPRTNTCGNVRPRSQYGGHRRTQGCPETHTHTLTYVMPLFALPIHILPGFGQHPISNRSRLYECVCMCVLLGGSANGKVQRTTGTTTEAQQNQIKTLPPCEARRRRRFVKSHHPSIARLSSLPAQR